MTRPFKVELEKVNKEMDTKKKFKENVSLLNSEEIKFLIRECEYVGFYLSYDLKGNNTDDIRSSITKKLDGLSSTRYKKIEDRINQDQTSGIVLSSNSKLTSEQIEKIIKDKAQDDLSKLAIIALLDDNWVINTFE